MKTKKRTSIATRCEAKAGPQGSELFIYGDIGADWFGEGITAKSVQAELAKCTGPVSVYINSPGGSVWEGMAIYSILKRHPEPVTCYVDALAASAASVIALGGSKLVMTEASLLMIHNAIAVAYGNAAEFRKVADDLEKISETIAGIYVEKTGLKLAEVTAMMDAETWLSAEDAVAKGFADEAQSASGEEDEPEEPAPVARLDTYRNTPEPLREVPATTAVARLQVELLRNSLHRKPPSGATGNLPPSGAGQTPATNRGLTPPGTARKEN